MPLEVCLLVRLITRNDTSLAVALIAATVILFQQPLRYVLEIAQDIEGRYHLDLIPALVLLTAVFVFHQSRKRVQAKADATAAAADATQARARSEQLEQLMVFGQGLANALDHATLQQVLWKHLPLFAPRRGFWVALENGTGWDVLLQDASGPTRSVEQIEQLASRALAGHDAATAATLEDACFPMLAGGATVGVLGVTNTPSLVGAERHALGAVAAVMAIGVRNMQLFLQTRELSMRDSLTECFNRGHGLETLDFELRRARRTGGALSVVMFDIDHFKTINDRYGHLKGDEVLAQIGASLTRIVRSTDVRCRYGGDEFLVILPDTPVLGAQQLAECLRQELGKIEVMAEGQPIPLAVSVGVAAATTGELDAKALIERADEALYRAKRGGRNRFCVAVPPSGALARSAG